jgi:hypothetical protein
MKNNSIKTMVIVALSGAVSMWLLAGLWHEIIMARFYSNETHATHEGSGIIFAAYLLLALLMAYIFPLGYSGGYVLWEGLRFGILIGLLWVFPHELAMAGAHGESLAYVFKNAVWHMFEQGIGGIVMAFTYKKVHLKP